MARRKGDLDDSVWKAYLARLLEDDTLAELRMMATTYYNYYAVCREAGFADTQAMAMVVALQTSNLEHAFLQNERDQDG